MPEESVPGKIQVPGIGPKPLREVLNQFTVGEISYGEFKWLIYKWLLDGIRWSEYEWETYNGDPPQGNMDNGDWMRRIMGHRLIWRTEMESRASTLLEMEIALSWAVDNGHDVKKQLEQVKIKLAPYPLTEGYLDLSLGLPGDSSNIPENRKEHREQYSPWWTRVGPTEADKERMHELKPAKLRPDLSFPGD